MKSVTGNLLWFGLLKLQAVITLLGIQLIVLGEIPTRTDDWAHLPTLAVGIGLAVAVFVGVLLVVRSSTAVGESLRAGLADTHSVLSPLSRPGIICIALGAGISEEVLFRACLQVWLGDVTHFTIGIAVNSLIFGLLHFSSRANFIFTTLYGLALSVVYHATQSLTLVITWHAAYDLIALYLLIKAPQIYRFHPESGSA